MGFGVLSLGAVLVQILSSSRDVTWASVWEGWSAWKIPLICMELFSCMISTFLASVGATIELMKGSGGAEDVMYPNSIPLPPNPGSSVRLPLALKYANVMAVLTGHPSDTILLLCGHRC